MAKKSGRKKGQHAEVGLNDQTAFEYYYNLGYKRSLAKVGEYFGFSDVTVGNCAKKNNWKKRMKEREQSIEEEMKKKDVDDVVQMNIRHIKMARYMQSKGVLGLQGSHIGDARVAKDVLKDGIDIERTAKGVVNGEKSNGTIIYNIVYGHRREKSDASDNRALREKSG